MTMAELPINHHKRRGAARIQTMAIPADFSVKL